MDGKSILDAMLALKAKCISADIQWLEPNKEEDYQIYYRFIGFDYQQNRVLELLMDLPAGEGDIECMLIPLVKIKPEKLNLIEKISSTNHFDMYLKFLEILNLIKDNYSEIVET